MKKNEVSLAILTPSYNRAHTLDKLFNSLQNQTNKNFVWIIVDDGSKDETKKIVENFIKKADFKISYIYKENGGKHTALNVGIKKITQELTLIVDSDDCLTEDAVETIIKDKKKIEGKEFCGISYLKAYDKEHFVGEKYAADEIVGTFVDVRYNKNCKGDKAEVFKTEILKQFPFPEIKGERFISEAVVWAKMSGPFKFLFLNKIIYICEYLEGGLSDNSHKLIFNNPIGASICYNVLSGKGFNFKNKLKYTLLYAASAIGAKQKKIVKNSSNPFLCFWLMPFAYIIYIKRKKQFGDKKK